MFSQFHLKNRLYDKMEEGIKEKLEEELTDDLFTEAPFNAKEAETTSFENYSYWRSTLKVFLSKKTTVFILSFLLILLVFCFVQPYLPGQKDPNRIFNNPETGIQLKNVAPCAEFWFGTNTIGQDLWSRIWAGTRTSLFIGSVTAVVSAAIGIAFGCIWGYAKKMDKVFTEIYNVLDNIPYTVLRTLITYILSPSLGTMIFVMCLTGWIGIARLIRNLVLVVRDREYNLASRCLGTPASKIIIRNVVPQLVSVIMLETALAIPAAIGTEVYLTYIGLGLPVSIPSLGNLINEGRMVMLVSSLRYQLFFPVLAVSAITISFYALGNAFSDASDPRNHK